MLFSKRLQLSKHFEEWRHQHMVENSAFNVLSFLDSLELLKDADHIKFGENNIDVRKIPFETKLLEKEYSIKYSFKEGNL